MTLVDAIALFRSSSYFSSSSSSPLPSSFSLSFSFFFCCENNNRIFFAFASNRESKVAASKTALSDQREQIYLLNAYTITPDNISYRKFFDSNKKSAFAQSTSTYSFNLTLLTVSLVSLQSPFVLAFCKLAREKEIFFTTVLTLCSSRKMHSEISAQVSATLPRSCLQAKQMYSLYCELYNVQITCVYVYVCDKLQFV